MRSMVEGASRRLAPMRQGGAPPTGVWSGSAAGGVKAPEPILLPDPAARFARTAARLERLAEGHPMQVWLGFMADVSAAQSAVAASLPPFAKPDDTQVQVAVEARIPPIAADGWRRDAIWREGLRLLLDRFDPALVPPAAAAVIADMRARPAEATEALADGFLRGRLDPSDAGAAFWIAAALQIAFTRLASGLRAGSLRLLEQRGLCPCCGSTPSAGVVRASGQSPGARYLHCSLCSTAWNHTRAICTIMRGLPHADAARDRRRSGRGQGGDLRRVPDLREGAVRGQGHRARPLRRRSRLARARPHGRRGRLGASRAEPASCLMG